MTELVIHDATVVTVDRENRILRDGTIRVADGEIVSVEPTAEADRRADADRVIDASGQIAIPGLVDAHRHTDFALVGGLFSDLDGERLLREAVSLYHNAEDELGDAFFEAGWGLACLRQLTNGITTVNAMDFTPEIGAEAVGESGLRGVIGPELADLLKPETPEEQLAEARSFVEEYHDAYGGRVSASIAPGGEVGCSRTLWQGVADLRREYPDLRLHTHLYDTPEADTMAAANGADDPIALLDELGLLDERTMVTHLLHADDEDARRIAESGAHVLHCATVYSYFRAGERSWFPLPALREAGANVALGLDDPFWFDCWDLLQEAKHARLLANFEYGSHQLSSYELVEMLTIDAARALGMADEIGSLEPGKRADVVLLDVDPARHEPFSNLPSLLTNAITGGDASTVIVDGDLLMHDGDVKSMCVEETITAAEHERSRLQEKTGWRTSLAGSEPPEKSIVRRISARPIIRAVEQYGHGFVAEHLP